MLGKSQTFRGVIEKIVFLTVPSGLVILLVVGAAVATLMRGMFGHYDPVTVYADAFTEESFAGLREGMSTQVVLEVMGEPIRRFTVDGTLFWAYSDIGHYTSKWEKAFHQRWVAFDLDGRVSRVISRTITTDHDPTAR